MPARKKEAAEVTLKPLNIQVVQIRIEGEKLVVHKFSEKARREIEEKQQNPNKARKKKTERKPHEDFLGALHVLGKDVATGEAGEKYGFPASAIKKAMVSACRQHAGLPMTVARGAFHVIGDLVEINAKKPVMRTDMVRLENGAADVRYRPEFRDWHMDVKIEYNADVVNPDTLVALLSTAGFAVGLGENRPEKSGDSWGRFNVATGGSKEASPPSDEKKELSPAEKAAQTRAAQKAS